MVRETGEEWGGRIGKLKRVIERESEEWRKAADQSDVRCSGGEGIEERRTVGRERGREEIERACRIIEPYMVTVKHEAI